MKRNAEFASFVENETLKARDVGMAIACGVFNPKSTQFSLVSHYPIGVYQLHYLYWELIRDSNWFRCKKPCFGLYEFHGLRFMVKVYAQSKYGFKFCRLYELDESTRKPKSQCIMEMSYTKAYRDFPVVVWEMLFHKKRLKTNQLQPSK